MRAMLRRLTRAACISVHAPDGSHSYVAIFFILVLPNTPTRARGLKRASPLPFLGAANVAPHAGAWIETSTACSIGIKTRVAPHAGAWIETPELSETVQEDSVAPHAGAWIETLN